ncbi:MAG: MarR family transcriptional regulator [Desulfovibrio sp.]|nr:MarR family transcriptional regulator [Desulfovibrio sp.]
MSENNEAAGASSENLAVLFHRAVKFMARAHHHHGHAEHAQMRVLALLKGRKSMNQRELQEMLNVRSASLSEILGKLEHRGFIERRHDEQDKRNFLITVTGRGSAAAAANEDVRRKSADALFASLSGEERQQLAELLDKIIRALEKSASGHVHYHDHGAGYPHGRGRHGHDGHGDWHRRGHAHHRHVDDEISGHAHHVPEERGECHDGK